MAAKVQGSFASGFEPVKEALEKLLNSGCEDKVQLCVYVGKDCVLDLYGSFGSNDSTYNSDTIQVLVRLKGLKLKPDQLPLLLGTYITHFLTTLLWTFFTLNVDKKGMFGPPTHLKLYTYLLNVPLGSRKKEYFLRVINA